MIAANPVTNKVYISKTFSNSMTVIDGATNAASILEGRRAGRCDCRESGNKPTLPNSYESNNVTVDRWRDRQHHHGGCRHHLWGIALNSASNKVYLSNSGSSNVTVLDGKTNATTLVNTGDIPCALAVDSSTGRVYAAELRK